MNTPNGLNEELALERAAIAEHEQQADRYWQSQSYAHAQAEQRAAREARKRVRKLEARLKEAR